MDGGRGSLSIYTLNPKRVIPVSWASFLTFEDERMRTDPASNAALLIPASFMACKVSSPKTGTSNRVS